MDNGTVLVALTGIVATSCVTIVALLVAKLLIKMRLNGIDIDAGPPESSATRRTSKQGPQL